MYGITDARHVGRELRMNDVMAVVYELSLLLLTRVCYLLLFRLLINHHLDHCLTDLGRASLRMLVPFFPSIDNCVCAATAKPATSWS